jgi:hypothetical protein
LVRRGSEATVYGHRSVNFSFRAWHDFCHWDGGYDFTLEGESATCEMHLFEFYGDCEKIRDWRSLLRADIVEQALFFPDTSAFLTISAALSLPILLILT